MINAAIVGIGRWGRTLVDSVQGKSENIRFVAGVTGTPDKAREYCAEKGIDLLTDYDALVARGDVDAVVIATPHTQHERQVLAAAAAGKHVFCEKPFMLTGDSARRAATAVTEAGLVLAVGHDRRWHSNSIELKRMIDSGELGTLLHIDGVFSAPLGAFPGAWRESRKESPGGGLTSLGIHAIDMMIHCGGRVSDVTARSLRRAIGFDIDDTTSALMNYESGATGYLVTLAQSAPLWQVRAFGSKGWAEIRGLDRLTKSMVGGSEETTQFDPVDSRAKELEAFAAAVAGGPAYPIPPDQIVHAVEVMDGIITSAEQDQRIRLG